MTQGVCVLLLRMHSASHFVPYLNNELSHCSLAFSGLGSVVSSSTALPCSEAGSVLPGCFPIPLAPCCLLLGSGCPCCSNFFSLSGVHIAACIYFYPHSYLLSFSPKAAHTSSRDQLLHSSWPWSHQHRTSLLLPQAGPQAAGGSTASLSYLHRAKSCTEASPIQLSTLWGEGRSALGFEGVWQFCSGLQPGHGLLYKHWCEKGRLLQLHFGRAQENGGGKWKTVLFQQEVLCGTS